MRRLAVDVPTNQMAIAQAVVRVLASDTVEEQEHAAQLGHDLTLDLNARVVLTNADAIPVLVRQVEAGSETASDHASLALGNIAYVSAEHRGEVTQQLISARHRAVDPRKQARTGRALSDLRAAENASDGHSQEHHTSLGMAILLFRLHERD